MNQRRSTICSSKVLFPFFFVFVFFLPRYYLRVLDLFGVWHRQDGFFWDTWVDTNIRACDLAVKHSVFLFVFLLISLFVQVSLGLLCMCPECMCIILQAHLKNGNRRAFSNLLLVVYFPFFTHWTPDDVWYKPQFYCERVTGHDTAVGWLSPGGLAAAAHWVSAVWFAEILVSSALSWWVLVQTSRVFEPPLNVLIN